MQDALAFLLSAELASDSNEIQQQDPLRDLAARIRDSLARTSPKISVVMTAHDSERSIESAIDSILTQTHRNLELIVVDDASTDSTRSRIEACAVADSRIRPLFMAVNRGTYWAKNLGIRHAAGDYVGFQDSDDVSTPSRLEEQLAPMLRDPDTLFTTSNYVRVDDSGGVVLNRGLVARQGFITLLLRRDPVVRIAGYFDSVRTSADDEYIHRLVHLFGKKAHGHVDKALYRAAVRGGSLSAKEVDLEGDKDRPQLLHLSGARKAYTEAYREWHTRSEAPHLRFPARSARPFEVDPSLLGPSTTAPVSVSVASMPSRIDGLERVVECLVPQCDRLFVYLNDYPEVPGFLDQPGIRVATSQQHGDIRDNGKFFFTDQIPSGYHFTVDDDINYPADYVDHTVAKLLQYGDRAMVGYHGIRLSPSLDRYFSTEREVIAFADPLDSDQSVNVIGTGTLAYHTNAIRLSEEGFDTTGMADIWVALTANRAELPMVAVARPRNFLTQMEGIAERATLFDEFAGGDDVQTQLIRTGAPWPLRDLPGPNA